jgi:hypothetical protein
MPNGTRRAHMVRRNGKTFWRSAARIKAPTQKAFIGIGLVGGGFLVAAGASPAVVAVFGVTAIGGWFAMKNRRHFRAMRRAGRNSYRAANSWARKKHLERTGRPARHYPSTGARLTAWAEQHQASRTGRPIKPRLRRTSGAERRRATRTGHPARRRDGAYLDSEFRPHYANAKFMSQAEWERNR